MSFERQIKMGHLDVCIPISNQPAIPENKRDGNKDIEKERKIR